MSPHFEPIDGGTPMSSTTLELVERWGPIVGRGLNADGSYQFIAFENGLVYESSRWLCSSDNVTTIWTPWSRRPCNDVSRLARLMDAAVEFA